ncbi:MAG: hypothetical protein HC880_03275 [Bacteroidia bacterium]|nr:hypothetical protein [Bacteroidia bacterium]
MKKCVRKDEGFTSYPLILTRSLFALIGWLSCTIYPVLALSEAEINRIYEEVKLVVLCKSVDFILSAGDKVENYQNMDCRDLDALTYSIPPEAENSQRFFASFRLKQYQSYGRDKLDARLNKLVQDMETELSKISADRAWQEGLAVLMIELKNTKDELVQQLINKETESAEVSEKAPTLVRPEGPTHQSNLSRKNMPLIYFFLLILTGGIGFLVWQNQQLKKQLADLEDQMQEKYSRLDNRMDTMTPVRDYQSLLLKFNFLNDQLNALVQEIVVLKNRNQYKITPEQLYAQRTEHLESYEFNPNVQIYYAKFRPDRLLFDPQEFKTEPSRDSIYKIEIDLENPEQAISVS